MRDFLGWLTGLPRELRVFPGGDRSPFAACAIS
jgi:hypothetical protein